MIKYPLASSSWDEKEIEAIRGVIAKGIYTMGDGVKQFEDDFAKFVNSKYAVMVNSGSSANLIAVAAMFYTKRPKLKRGDEVIVPAVSWSTTYYPLHQYGLKLKFVDVDLNTLNFDLDIMDYYLEGYPSNWSSTPKAIFISPVLMNWSFSMREINKSE